MKERDELFRELFGREPTREELHKFSKIGSLMSLKPGDSMWHVIMVNEFYEDRLNNRLAEIDRVADNAAEKALVRISEAVYQKSEDIAKQRNRGFMLRSWGFAQSMTLMLCVIALNAGYIMGSGKYPFWLRPANTGERILSWFFNVPSGWLVVIGCAPFFVEILKESAEKLRMGIEKDFVLSLLKATGSSVALIFLLFIVLGF